MDKKGPAVPQISVEETKDAKVTPAVPVIIKEPSPAPGSRRGSYVDIPSPAGSRRGSIIIADEVGCQRARPGLCSKSHISFKSYNTCMFICCRNIVVVLVVEVCTDMVFLIIVKFLLCKNDFIYLSVYFNLNYIF